MDGAENPGSGARDDCKVLALTAEEMNAKYKETSECGLAVPVVLVLGR